MALLSDPDRLKVSTDYQADASHSLDTLAGIVKADLLAAVGAIDQWVSDNTASFNSAIPQPARGALTTTQKARLLMFVIRQRYLSGV